ncbi:MAG: penicillin-binding protein 1A [Myxococcaceae bacterium]
MTAPELKDPSGPTPPPAPEPAPQKNEVPREKSKLVLDGVPKRPLWKKALFALMWLSLVGATAAACVVGFLYWKYSEGLPAIPKVDEYFPPIISEVYTDDAVLAGEFYNERRKVVPYERIPKRLVQAFIASEDSSFFDHFGVDVPGTARAAFKTVFKKLTGKGSVQGGSTLTQQTAKAVLISAEGYKTSTEKSLKRKIREAILATRLESALTKEEILYLYLNNVYLGHWSYGVQSAAENYFRKDVKDLTLAEMALIAGLPQAPTRFSPFLNPKAAKARRHYVLGRMLTEGMITKAEFDQADADEPVVYPVEDVFHEFSPYFTETVRKDVVDRYTNPVLLQSGLKVFTTMDSEKQRAAQEAVLSGLLSVDKRQGFRGPVMELKSDAERKSFIEKSAKVMGDEKLTLGHYYVGLVTMVQPDGKSATVMVGHEKGTLPLLGMRWARKLNPEGYYPSTIINSIKGVLKEGDVIVVRAVEPKQLWDDKEQYSADLEKNLPTDTVLLRLEQEPELQSALVSIDPHRQYLVAMVGGYDFDANEFNRAFQACRQPGSQFKPFTYSAAIEGWGKLKDNPKTEASVIVDSPVVMDDDSSGIRWKPQNYDTGFVGDVLLRTALVNSMNIPAVKTFNDVGVMPMVDWAKRLGLNTPINTDLSSALGSSCVYPIELAGVYATFNRMGVKKPTYFVRKIEDRFGRRVEDHTSYDDPWATLEDRVGGGYARLFEPGERVFSKETGFILVDLLRGVVKDGTGAPAQKLGKPAAGKTGTTNDSFDAWFSGFTRDLVTTTWIGYDLNPHPLGRYETGGRASLPIWLSYMKVALDGRPQPEFEPPPGANLVQLRIDNKTGNIASSGTKSSTLMWFKNGTEPKDVQLGKDQVDSSQFMMQN